MSRLRKPAGPLPAPTLLQLMWLASPALPVGGFSYSEGLEAAVESGAVRDEAQVRDWLLDQLHLVQVRGDLAAAARAHNAWRRHDAVRLHELNTWVRTTRETSEMRLQAEQMGRSLADWLRHRDAASGAREPRLATLAALQPAPTWPVVHALAAHLAGAPAREALLAYTFGWAENMVQAAIKSVPLGQSAGQRILGWLAEAIPAACDRALALADSERQAYAPMLAILSAQHEAQYSRLFRS
jgi:urease accessory protein